MFNSRTNLAGYVFKTLVKRFGDVVNLVFTYVVVYFVVNVLLEMFVLFLVSFYNFIVMIVIIITAAEIYFIVF
jgi:hypothetical protein